MASAAAASGPISRPRREFAARTGRLEHHLVVPGRTSGQRRRPPRAALAAPGRLQRLPGASRERGLQATLRGLEPDVVLLHDPFWTPRLTSRAAHESGAVVIAVHHSSAALHAAGLPGPHTVYAGALRRWYRRAYNDVDAVMSVVDPAADTHRTCTLRLRLGLDPAFGPQPGVQRGDHVLYVGRLSREKGLRELLEAAAGAASRGRWSWSGPAPPATPCGNAPDSSASAQRVRFEPYIQDREQLARAYAAARCAVLPGAHETFGLAALEAAACGTPVVTAAADALGAAARTDASTPSAPATAPTCCEAIERPAAGIRIRPRRRCWPPATAGTPSLEAELADLQSPPRVGERDAAGSRSRSTTSSHAPTPARATSGEWLTRARRRARHAAGDPRRRAAPTRAPGARRSTAWLRSRVACGDAVAQHGLAHKATAPAGWPRSALARWQGGAAAEFPGLGPRGRARRVEVGLRLLREVELDPRGFVAPGYAYTRALRAVLAESFEWFADLRSVRTRDRRPRPGPRPVPGQLDPAKRALSPVAVRAAARAARRPRPARRHPSRRLRAPAPRRHAGMAAGARPRTRRRHLRRAGCLTPSTPTASPACAAAAGRVLRGQLA